MKQIVALLTLLFCLLPLSAGADNYTQLWKQFEQVQLKDLPKTQLEVLEKISKQATRERAYGHLVKAELLSVTVLSSLSPDSLLPARIRLETREREASDKVLKAVYNLVIGKLYENGYMDADNTARTKECYARALENPDLLASVQDASYAPLVEVGVDSKVFNHDLLHVVGFEIGAFDTLHKYYEAKGNRSAACYTALEMKWRERKTNAQRMASLDSLIRLYDDLPIACEVAINRYSLMRGGSRELDKARFEFLNEAIGRWKDYPRANVLRNQLARLTVPRFSARLEKKVLQPNKEYKIFFPGIRNVGRISMDVYRLREGITATERLYDDKEYARVMQGARLLMDASQTKTYTGYAAYEQWQDSLTLKQLPVGVYLLEFHAGPAKIEPSRMIVRVSDLFVFWIRLPDQRVRAAVVNATTGEPVPHAQLALSNSQGKLSATVTTDGQGEYLFQKPNFIYIRPYKGTDHYAPWQNFDSDFYYSKVAGSENAARLYTDRALYRPGQTVHVAMVAYKILDGKELSVLRQKAYTLTLYDNNYKAVAQQEVVTDAFGSASADFVLPANRLTGTFSIGCGDASVYFRVEEYKRPTFEVAFDAYTEKYAPGDTLLLTGRARSYTGVPVQGAKVRYNLSRTRSLWWRSWGAAHTDFGVFQSDTALTDAQGEFKIRVPMVLPKRLDNTPIFCNISVEATVTDLSGESHDGSTRLPLGSKATAFSCNLPARELKDSLTTLTFSYLNAAGKEIPGMVAYTINDKKYTTKANETLDIKKQIALLPSGRHHLQAVCGNDTIRQDFVVFSLQDKKAVVETHDWFYQTANTFPRDGSPVHIQLGSSAPVQHVAYTLVSGKRLLESGSIDLRGELYHRAFSYKPEYGNGLVINYVWVKEGVAYCHPVQIAKLLPDKRLLMRWTTFRNKLVPGQQEEWVLNISRPGGKLSKAQLYATLFDKSMDQIRKHSWIFNPNLYFMLPQMAWEVPYIGGHSSTARLRMKSLEEPSLDFSHLYHHSFLYGRLMGLALNEAPVKKLFSVASPVAMTKAAGVEAVRADVKVRGLGSLASSANAAEGFLEGDEQSGKHSGDTEGAAPKQTAGQLRENLSETAFFYPNLETDAQGNVKIKFTLPESLTTWRFIGFAHDSWMNYGILEGEAVAQKKVMVQPNLPRFLRLGDKATLSSKIFNTTSENLSGTATMQLLDAETQEIVYEEKTEYTLPANGTTTVSFSYQPESADRMLVCKIMASGKNYGDGEQHYLPILPDRELVTNTVPFTQNGAGTKTIDLDRLFPVKRSDNKLTVEYTNNPAWLMVQALPYVGDANEHNAISLTAAYYANSIASNLLRQSPVIKQTIDLWRQERGGETALMSSLEKNQALKAMLLEETPWVMEAEKESDQKQRLFNFFDENTLSMRLGNILADLRKLQRTDGSFSWWSGMEGSPHMTMAVVKMLVRLDKMMGSQSQTRQIQAEAFAYLDKRMQEEVYELKREGKKGVKKLYPSELACNYLYCNALAGRERTNTIDYLLSLLMKKPTEYTIYGKANSAVILALYGEEAKAREYLQSVKEYTVYKEEMGRYFDTPKAQYSWFDYRIPSQVAAIEALKLLQPTDRQTLEEMQRWLLQAKRTQGWDTPLNSVDAVYAFLNGQVDKLTPANDAPAVLEVDGKQLSADHQSAAIGYVKGHYQGADLHQFTARKTTDHTSWGAVYAQFMQPVVEVQDASAGLTIKRELLNKGQQLKVGDRVTVRITITADRDYDFVQVQDKRAACMEPVGQLSGYHWGYYCAPKDNVTNYYFDTLSKGRHVVETEYYIDRVGDYETGTCSVQCAYSPEFMAREAAKRVNIK